MTCPNCGRALSPGATCCSAGDQERAWVEVPVDGYTVPATGAVPLAVDGAAVTGSMHRLRTSARVASRTISVNNLVTLVTCVLATLDSGPYPSWLTTGLPVVGSAAALVALIASLVWMYAAQSNVYLFPDARPRWVAGWTTVSWFIPLANLVLVPMVLLDTVRNTVPPQQHSERRVLSTVVVFWWLTFVAGVVVAGIANRVDLGSIAKLAMVDAAGGLRLAAGAAFTVLLIRVTQIQRQRIGQPRPAAMARV